MRRLASSTWATMSRTWTTGAVGELDDGLGGDAARDLARRVAAHAVGDDVDGARGRGACPRCARGPVRRRWRDRAAIAGAGVMRSAPRASPHGVTRTVVSTWRISS